MRASRYIVQWTAAGLPPSYVERRWRAEVPDRLCPAFEELLRRTRFFDVSADLGSNPPEGRDMASYSITVDSDGHTHGVRYSDATATQDTSDLWSWIVDNLLSGAVAE
jgi:hypothetical protein